MFALMEMWELVARESIRDTEARYNHAGDSGRYDEMIACFTDDGVLAIVGGEEHRGHAALRSFFGSVGSSAAPGFTHLRHCMTNLLINIESPERASAQSYFQVITDIGLDHWGRYRDRLVPVGARWLLEHRSVKTDGYASNSYFT